MFKQSTYFSKFFLCYLKLIALSPKAVFYVGTYIIQLKFISGVVDISALLCNMWCAYQARQGVHSTRNVKLSV
jgi:hypothetical protein